MHVHRENAVTVLPVVAATMTPEMATRAPKQGIGPTQVAPGKPRWKFGRSTARQLA